MSFPVRVAGPEDVDVIVAIAASSALASQWGCERYLQMIAAPDGGAMQHLLLVAESTGEVIGFAAARALVAIAPAEVELENIAVLPNAQGCGAGSALLQGVMGWAVSLGAGPVRLEVRAANTAAIRLYRRHGFVEMGVRKGYYAAPVDDAVCMECPEPCRTTAERTAATVS